MARSLPVKMMLLVAVAGCMRSTVSGDPGGGPYVGLAFEMRCQVSLVCPTDIPEQPTVETLYDEKLCIGANGIDTADDIPIEHRLREVLCEYPTCLCTAFCKPAGVNNYCVGAIDPEDVP